MWNVGDVPARMIEIVSPAGFERFFHEVAEMIAAGPVAGWFSSTAATASAAPCATGSRG